MTLTLGLWPKQGYRKVWVGSATWESHSHSWECGRVLNEPTHPQVDNNLKNNLKCQNLLNWGLYYSIGKLLKCRYLKWGSIIHLNTSQVMAKRKAGGQNVN